jgi:hypothetical protein
MSEPTLRVEHVSLISDYNERLYNLTNHTDNTTHHSSVLFQGTNSVQGVKVPNWRDVIRSGQNATTPLTGTKYTLNRSFASLGVQWSKRSGQPDVNGAEYFGFPNYPNVLSTSVGAPNNIVTSVTNRCIRKFLDKAESIRSSVESGQDFGEYRETLNGIRDPLSQLRRHVLGYFPRVKKLKGLYKDARSLTKALADTYLEWTFGWKPLASDIADAYVGLLNRSRFGQRQAIRVSARDTYPVSVLSDTQLSSLGGFGQVLCSSRTTGEYTVVMYGMIRTGVGPDGLVSRAQTLQLDLPHFVPTIWDLIPYSFIVDYFTNVGDIIRSLSVIDSEFIWGGQTTINANVQDFSDLRVIWSPNPQYSQDFNFAYGGRASSSVRTIQRSILSPSGLIPRLQITLPLGSDKPWINMGAILASRIAELVPLF